MRTKAAWLAAALASGPSLTLADDPPTLAGPEGGPVLEAPAASGPAPISNGTVPLPAPAPVAPRRPRDDRPMLALPGVTMPAPRPLPPAEPMPPSLGPTLEASPPLLPPTGTTRGTSGPVTDLPALPSSRFRGRVIESTPAPAGDLLPPIDVPPPGPTRRSAGRPPLGPSPSLIDELPEMKDPEGRRPGLDRPEDDEKKEKDQPRDWSKPLAPRRPNLFGNRWVNPFAGRPLMDEAGSDVRAEGRSDPAADAAVKRRIEKQAEAAVGDKVRHIDVRVVGRSVTIQAHGARLFQRRAVKRSLETLPGLSGYRATIDLVD